MTAGKGCGAKERECFLFLSGGSGNKESEKSGQWSIASVTVASLEVVRVKGYNNILERRTGAEDLLVDRRVSETDTPLWVPVFAFCLCSHRTQRYC